ncbi:stealth conserved region 3 domain-containing protein [Brachybacterium alimentarium]|uniref:stealth conserved region 3 domain-containing protein n=1 Tax=Brachybacterium alimentarium TaxID=47845 RepID=UPI003FD5D43A
MITSYVKRAARRVDLEVERATGKSPRSMVRAGRIGQRRGESKPGQVPDGAKQAALAHPIPHGQVGAEAVSMPKGLQKTSRVHPLSTGDLMEHISAFRGVSGYFYEAKTDIIRIAARDRTASELVGACFEFAVENGFEIVPVALSRGARAPRSLADMESELLGKRASRFQFVDSRNLSTPFSVQLELWSLSAEGHFGSPRNNNTVSRIWNYADREDEGCSQDLVSFLPGPPLSSVQFDIDWVFTWVNGQDPEWQEIYRQWAPRIESDASDGSRFEHRDDLMFALRSLDEYAPWIRRIHIVSNCKPPAWLDLSSDRIRWVWHEELFEPSELPTFNSHAIETTLHKIPELAEHFVYSNDDFYLARRVCPEDFFASNGLCLSKLEPYGMVNGEAVDGDPDYLNAARNSGQLIFNEYGGWPVQLHTHSPQSLRVSILEEMEGKFSEEFIRTRASKFRTANDIAVSGFMFHHYAYASGRALAVDARTQLIQQNHDFEKAFAKLSRDRNRWSGSPKLSFCVNDGKGSMDNVKWNRSALEFLCKYFPEKSRFEK